eukprot:scaffold12105_cov30-Phaeocystis_antarctica.AAC.2
MPHRGASNLGPADPGQNPRLADGVPGRPATHTLEPRLGQLLHLCDPSMSFSGEDGDEEEEDEVMRGGGGGGGPMPSKP